MESIAAHYMTISQSNENVFVPVFKDLAKSCSTVIECSTGREVATPWALLAGLAESEADAPKVLYRAPMTKDSAILFKPLLEAAKEASIEVKTKEDLAESEQADVVFIDSCNVESYAKTALEEYHARAKRLIVLFTTAPRSAEQTMRAVANVLHVSRLSGFTVQEIMKGLGTAVDDFVAEHPEWIVKDPLGALQGLVILERSSSPAADA